VVVNAPSRLAGLFHTRGYALLWLIAAALAAGQALTLHDLQNFRYPDPTAYDSQVVMLIGLAIGLGMAGGYLCAAALADQRSKRRLLLAALLILTLLAICTALVNLSAAPPEIRIPIAALFGVTGGAATVLTLGWLADLLPRRLLARGVAIWSVTSFSSGLLLILLFDRAAQPIWFLAVGVGLYLCAVFLARRAPGGDRPMAPPSALFEGLSHTVRYARRDLRLQTLLIYTAVSGGALALGVLFLLDYRLDWRSSGLEPLDNSGSVSIATLFGLQALWTFVAAGVLLILINSRRRWWWFIAAAATVGAAAVILPFLLPLLGWWSLGQYLLLSSYVLMGGIVGMVGQGPGAAVDAIGVLWPTRRAAAVRWLCAHSCRPTSERPAH